MLHHWTGDLGGKNLRRGTKQHCGFAVGKFPERKSSSAGGGFCLQSLACLGFAGRRRAEETGSVLAVPSLHSPPTAKGVKLLRCCSLVAWKWHGRHARSPCWWSLAVFEILFHALPAVSAHQLIAAAAWPGVCALRRWAGGGNLTDQDVISKHWTWPAEADLARYYLSGNSSFEHHMISEMVPFFIRKPPAESWPNTLLFSLLKVLFKNIYICSFASY